MEALADVFSNHRNKKFIFVEPGGNWGDYLIYFGADLLAKKYGVNFESLSVSQFMERTPDDAFIYIHGGGGFNEWCSGSTFICLNHALKSYPEMVIYGPCTTSLNLDFLTDKFNECVEGKISKEFIFFARENTTFDIIKKIPSICHNAKVLCDYDTAFHVSKKDVFDRIGTEKNDYCLYGYRKDNECSNVHHKGDISKIVIDPPMFAKSFDHWLRVHAYASEIITNRTHSSIIGAILGKKTTLFASKYHKNRSIWQYSLESMGVVWVDDSIATQIANQNFLIRCIPNKIHTSSKIQKLVNLFKKIPSR